MSDERCTCCDLPAFSCGRAAEARARVERIDEERRLVKRGAFRAHYVGICATCRSPFDRGTFVKTNPEGDGYDAECCL